MKYWRGYLTAAILGFFTWALIAFAKSHTALMDTVYPYITRMVQSFLAEWSSGVTFCLWQFLAVVLVLIVLTTIVLMIVLRWNPIQLIGWYTAVASFLFFLHTALFGLNAYSGSIADDVRLNVTEYTVTELAEATTYYRDQANALAAQVHRNSDGSAAFAPFQELALQAEDGFHTLVYEQSYPIFAGSTLPVKELGWADIYTSMGIPGFTMALTGEAAVNPQIPAVVLPFTMCSEMSYRMAISADSDRNMAAFMACQVNDSVQFRYSGYFMAYRYCYNALTELGTVEAQEAAQRIKSGISELLYYDIAAYNAFFSQTENRTVTPFSEKVNEALSKITGKEHVPYQRHDITSLLVSWHIKTIVLPSQIVEDTKFDPFDETQVDLSGMVHGPAPTETQPAEG